MNRRFALAAAAIGICLTLAAPAGAAGDGRIVIRKADATQFPQVRMVVQVSGDSVRTGDLHVRENGRLVNDFEAVPIDDTSAGVGIVLLVDVSDSMAENDAIQKAKDAAKDFIRRKRDTEAVAVVAFGAKVSQVTDGFTADRAELLKAVDSLKLDGSTRLWDGVKAAANLFADQRGLQPNIVLLSDGKDHTSRTTEADAKGSALEHEVAVFPIGLGSDLAEGSLRSLASATGGNYFAAQEADALDRVYSEVQNSLQNQFEIHYTSNAPDAALLDLEVSAGSMSSTKQVASGSSASGALTQPKAAGPDPGVPFLQSDMGKWVGAGLGLVAVAVIAYAVLLLVVRDGDALSAVLQPYADGIVIEDDRDAGGLSDNRFLHRAVEITTQMAERQGLLPKLEQALERADLPLRAGEALFVYIVAAFALLALTVLASQSLIISFIALVLIALLPPGILNLLAARRRKKFMSQLPDTLQLLAGSLRAGYSLMQGVEAVSQEVEDPMGRELRRVVVESRLGRPLEESLEDAAKRMGSNDFAWAVMAIRIQREVGGNLSELLLTVADTMVARERLRRDVSALTAEGKISAIVLGLLPVGLGAAMYAINPTYINVLITQRIGNFMLGGAILLALGGFAWMRKTIQIEV